MSDIRIGLIGGTGLAEAIAAEADGVRHDIDTPFGRPSDSIIETQWEGVTLFTLARHGPGHILPPAQVPFRANIFALKKLGVTHIIASGAVGSLREELRPRDLVIVDQVIDKTFRRVGTFFDNAAVHVEMAEPFCPVLRRMLLLAAKPDDNTAQPQTQADQPPPAGLAPLGQPVASESTPQPRPFSPRPDYTVHDRGCYVCMEGPALSTRAESLMHRLWGGDLIGMTAMPEAKLAREAEIPYALIALVTDCDCWRQPALPKDATAGAEQKHPNATALLEEIIGNLKAASANAIDLIKRTIRCIAEHRDELANCPATRALELAIWSDKSKIDPAEVQRLAPLWMKYFEPPAPAAPGDDGKPLAQP